MTIKTPAPSTTHAKAPAPKLPRPPRVKVNITQELVEQSKLADSSHCMIAEAVKIAYPDATKVSVDLQTIRFSNPAKRVRYIYLTPRLAQIALVQFDQGREVEPFSFTLAGAHVIGMYERPLQRLQGIEADQDTGATKPIEVAVKNRERTHKARLAKQGLRFDDNNGSVPRRVGGKAPPSTPFSRRRAFGLRALER